MLFADRDAFENAAMQLWHVASWVRGDDGLLVAPPSTDVERFRAAVRGALCTLFNAPIEIGRKDHSHVYLDKPQSAE